MKNDHKEPGLISTTGYLSIKQGRNLAIYVPARTNQTASSHVTKHPLTDNSVMEILGLIWRITQKHHISINQSTNFERIGIYSRGKITALKLFNFPRNSAS